MGDILQDWVRLDTVVWVEWSKSTCADGDIIESPIKITAGCRGANMEQLTFMELFILFAHRLKLEIFPSLYTLDKTF